MVTLAFILSLLAGSSARAEPVCETGFSRLVNKASAKVALLTPAEARARLEQLDRVTVRNIFPESRTVRTGRRAKEERVKDDSASIKRYKDHFDRLWDARVTAKQIPSWDLAEYRAWLKNQSLDKSAYPPIRPKELLEDYVNDEGTINEYLDFHYLEYLEKVKGLRPDNVEAYLQKLDKSMVRHLGRASLRRLKNFGKSFYGGAAGALFAVALAFPGELVNAVINPWVQPIKEYFTSRAKEASNQAKEKTVRDWQTLFVGGEEKYVSTLLALKMASKDLEAREFDTMSRAEAAKTLDDFMKFTAEKLPQFHATVLSEQKNFEANWDARLQELKQSTIVVNAGYQQHKIALDQLQTILDGRTPPAAPGAEELERMAEYQQEMTSSEAFLANALADWLFYKQARGLDRPLDPALDRNFTTVYGSYLRTMSPGLLADAINARVAAHISQLEKYSAKVTGLKVDGPTQPVAKPEDQIKTDEAPISGGTETKADPNSVPLQLKK